MSQSTGYFQFYNSGERPSKVRGIDVSHWQTDGTINFASAYAAGDRFAIFKVGGVYASSFSARYIKCTVNGSYTNTDSIFNEIQVYDIYGNEYAAGKTVTGSQVTPLVGSYSSFVDGDVNTYVIVGTNTQWVKVDLGSTISVYHILLWHYNGRTFKNNKVEYSTDNITWYTLFDSATSGEYAENQGIDLFKYGGISKDSINWTATKIASARAAGLKVGTYFFKNPNYWNVTSGRFLVTTADASSDASAYYQYITSALGASASDTGDCFAWLDLENDQGSMYPSLTNEGAYDYITTFCNTFKALASGRQCGLYTAYYTVDTLTATTALHLCRSVAQTVGSALPLWFAVVIDYSSSYPSWSYQSFGYFEDDLWTIWQYSADNTSGANHGMLAGTLDLDLLESTIESIMQPTPVSSFLAVGASTTIAMSWVTGGSDVRGYMYVISGEATATVNTGVGSAMVLSLLPNTSYSVKINSFDQWEISDTITTSVVTTGSMVGYHSLLCFKA